MRELSVRGLTDRCENDPGVDVDGLPLSDDLDDEPSRLNREFGSSLCLFMSDLDCWDDELDESSVKPDSISLNFSRI